MGPQDFTSKLASSLVPWLILITILGFLAIGFKVVILPKLKGWFGESIINFLAKKLDKTVYRLIPNVMLPTPDGTTTQIDHVIVSRYGIFVVETKNYKGWIYGGEHDAQWTQSIYRHKEHFQNPLRQNYKHTKTLSDLTGIPADYFKSIVVFVGDSTFKTPMPVNVVNVSGLIRHIKSYQTHIIKDAQVPEIAEVIQAWAGTVTKDQKANHVSNLRKSKGGSVAGSA